MNWLFTQWKVNIRELSQKHIDVSFPGIFSFRWAKIRGCRLKLIARCEILDRAIYLCLFMLLYLFSEVYKAWLSFRSHVSFCAFTLKAHLSFTYYTSTTDTESSNQLGFLCVIRVKLFSNTQNMALVERQLRIFRLSEYWSNTHMSDHTWYSQKFSCDLSLEKHQSSLRKVPWCQYVAVITLSWKMRVHKHHVLNLPKKPKLEIKML